MENSKWERKNQIRLHLGPNTTVIPADAFQESCKLQEIHLHENLKRIESQAFQKCVALRNVVIGMDINNLTHLGIRCFDGCVLLKQVNLLESSIRVLTRATFRNCVSLESVSFPEPLEIIAKDAFRGCQFLKDVYLSHSQLQIIGQDWTKSILGMLSALKKVALSSKVKKVRPQVFQDCVQLQMVVLRSKKCKVDKTAFANCPKVELVRRSFGTTIPPTTTAASTTTTTTAPSMIAQLQRQVTTVKQDILQLSDRYEQDLLEKENDLRSTRETLNECRLTMESKNATIQRLMLEKNHLIQQLNEERKNKRKHPEGNGERRRRRQVSAETTTTRDEPPPKRRVKINDNNNKNDSGTTDGTTNTTKDSCNLM